MNREWIGEKMLGILAQGGETTVSSLAQAINRPSDKTTEALTVLVQRGLVCRSNGNYSLTNAGQLAASSDGRVRTGGAGQPRRVRVEPRNLRARAWKALRMEGGKSTLGNLLHLLLTGEEKSADTNLLKYFDALCQAGILTRAHRRARGSAPTSNGYLLWIISVDVGPKAPVWQRAKKQVFDPNSGNIFPLIARFEGQDHGNSKTKGKIPRRQLPGASIAGGC
ncbi:MAG: hypothetical protein HQL90_11095 [Magnetococcales bacterium]|nr:hypothetical protein [Magnetococcales bacterium]